jgi:hypothetical protein
VPNCRCGYVFCGALKLLIRAPYPRLAAHRFEAKSSVPELLNEREKESVVRQAVGVASRDHEAGGALRWGLVGVTQ